MREHPCSKVIKLQIIPLSLVIRSISLPVKPATKPRADKCQTYESNFDYESYIKDCIDNVETIIVTDEIEDEDLE